MCIAHRHGNDATRAAGVRLNESGDALVTLTEVDGEAVLRLSVGSPSVAHEDVERLWSTLES